MILRGLLFALIAVWIGGELVIFTRSAILDRRTSSRRDRASFIAVFAGIYLGFTLASVLVAIAPGAGYGAARQPIFGIGFALAVGGIALRWYAVGVLGRFFTVTVQIQEGHRLVETGPYRWVRHPSYTGGLATMLGVLLCYGNYTALLGLVPVGLAFAYRIAVEERALTEALGDSYRAYARRTHRLIPGLL